MARPILLHVIVADKLLPLIKARYDAVLLPGTQL